MNKLRMFLAVLMSVMSLHAFCVDFTIDGIKYSDLYTGTENRARVNGCSPEMTEINIPEKIVYEGKEYFIKGINNYAFANNTTIEKITIPDGVNSIGDWAFHGCTSLKTIFIPDAVTEIGNGAFSGCSSLKGINIPDAVREIPNHCFSNCSTLEEINISTNSTLAKLGKEAFYSCSCLKKINIPDDVTEIPNYCFYQCSALEEVNISANSALTKIWECAFQSCSNLKEINVPDAVIEIPYSCFFGCSALEEVNISANSALTKIGGSAFGSCSSLKKINISDGVTEIWGACFSNCSALEEVNISANSALTKIGGSAFRSCSNLKKINVPDAVTEIPNNCFYGCSALEEINISANSTLAKLGEEAFRSCRNLKQINIPDAVLEIPPFCFLSCSALEEVNISTNSALEKVGMDAFQSCSSLKKINIPDGVTEIWGDCFYQCSALEEVNISANSALTMIGGSAFQACSSLKKINIPDAVKEIPSNCFFQCSALEKVNISDNSALTKIGSNAFQSCSSLKEINIPDGVTEIPYHCFSGCIALEKVNISANSALAKLGTSAFYSCSSLKNINIPDAVTEIHDYCFQNSGLEYFVFSENLKTINKSPFSGCNSLNSVLFMQPTPPTMIRNLSNNTFIYVPQKYYDAYVEAGVDQYFKLIALDDEQVADYKENGEAYGNGVNDYLAVTIDGKDFYNFKATLQNNYCESLELVRYIIREKDTSTATINHRYSNNKVAAGKQVSLTKLKEDDKQYVFEWYYMYDGKLCKKSSADVVDHPKFYQNNLGFALNGENAELIGSAKDLTLAVIPKTVEWSGKNYPVTKVSETAFESRSDLKAVVDMNGSLNAESLKTTAPIYVADAKGNTKLKEFVSWDNHQFVYTGKIHKPAWTNNLSEFAITATADAQTSKKDVGDYTENVAFTFTYQKQTLEVQLPCKYSITPAPLTAEVQNAQRAYGTENPKFEVKYTGFVNNETAAVVTKAGEFATDATVKSPVGEYDVTLTGVEAKNYEVSTKPGKLTIHAAKITAKVNSAERVYGDENPKFALTLNGLVNDDKQEDVLTSTGKFTTDATKTSDVGEYAVKCSGVKAKNYEVEAVDGLLKVTPAKLTAWVNDATRTYGADNPQFSAFFTGFRNNDNADVLTNSGAFSTTATKKSDVGDYEITMKGAQAKNYTFEYEPGTLTVTKAPLTAEVQNVQRAYGADNPQFTAKYSGFVNGENESVLTNQGVFTTEATKESPAGEYAITLTGVEAKNYEITTIDGKLTIGIVKLIVKVNDAERVYGDDNPEFTYTVTGLMNDDRIEDVLTSTGSFTTSATNTSNVGQYTVKCIGVKAKNYEVETVDGTLTVTPAKLTAWVNDATRTYGADNPQFSAFFTGFRNNDNADVLTNSGSFSTTATKKSDVGEYEITMKGAQAKNYTFEYEPGTLTVTKAPLTAEVQNVQRAYGADNPQFTAKFSGFVNGENESVLTNQGVFTTEATKESPAGEYAITLTGVEAKNYEVTTIDGKLTIGIVKLIVKVNDAERVYGDDNPEFTYTVTGLMNDDRIEDVLTSTGSFTTSATNTSNVGQYAVKCIDVKAKNYEVETVDGTLTVTPAQVIVRVNNATRPYGEENPQFTARYVGWRNGETNAVLSNKGTFNTTAMKTSDVGEYEITATGAQAKNYTFTYEPGVLTIEQAEQQVVWEQPLDDIVQFAQLELTAIATSGLPVSYQVTKGSDVCSVVKVGKTTFLDCFGTGDVTITAWQEGNKNYYPTLRTYKQVKVVPTDISNAEAGKYSVTTKRGQLLIGGLNEGDVVTVTDLAGRTVYSGDESTVYLARGSYIVRIGKWMKKVLVK